MGQQNGHSFPLSSSFSLSISGHEKISEKLFPFFHFSPNGKMKAGDFLLARAVFGAKNCP